MTEACAKKSCYLPFLPSPSDLPVPCAWCPSLCWCPPCPASAKVDKVDNFVDTSAWNTQKAYRSRHLVRGRGGLGVSSQTVCCWPQGGDACRVPPRRFDCACLEDDTRKAGSRGSTFDNVKGRGHDVSGD